MEQIVTRERMIWPREFVGSSLEFDLVLSCPSLLCSSRVECLNHRMSDQPPLYQLLDWRGRCPITVFHPNKNLIPGENESVDSALILPAAKRCRPSSLRDDAR